MVEEILVKEALSDELISAGAELIRQMDQMKWPVSASLWIYLPNLNRWRLVLASEKVSSEGPRKAYINISSALASMPGKRLSLEDIAVVEPDEPTIAALRTAVQTSADAIAGIRFTDSAFNGRYIGDVHIYRLS